MSMKLIWNGAWFDCAQLLVTDASDAVTTDGNQNFTRGPRHLEWTQSGTAVRRLVYVEKGGTLAGDTAVITRADRLTAGYTLRKYSAYPGSPTTIESSAGVPSPLVGASSQDYVTSFAAVTSGQAFSLEILGSAQKTLNKFYVGTAIEFLYPQGPSFAPQYQDFQRGKKVWQVDEVMSIEFQSVTKAQLATLEYVWRIHDEPVFLWDAAKTLIMSGLWHAIITQVRKVQTADDMYSVTVEAARLREYPRVP